MQNYLLYPRWAGEDTLQDIFPPAISTRKRKGVPEEAHTVSRLPRRPKDESAAEVPSEGKQPAEATPASQQTVVAESEEADRVADAAPGAASGEQVGKVKKRRLSSKQRKKTSGPSNAQEAQGFRDRLGELCTSNSSSTESPQLTLCKAWAAGLSAGGAAEGPKAPGGPSFAFGFSLQAEEPAKLSDREPGEDGPEGTGASPAPALQAGPIVSERTRQRLARVTGTGPGMGCERRVFAAGMPFRFEEEEVRECWESCGEVETLDLLRFPDTQRFRGIAFITFKTEEGYKAALEWDGEMLENTRLKVEPCKEPRRRLGRPSGINGGAGVDAGLSTQAAAPKTPGYHVAYVGNLDYEATDEAIREHFEGCEVTVVRIHTDAASGQPKGYAHVHFSDEASLDRAVTLNGTQLLARNLRVGYAQPKKAAAPAAEPAGT